MCGDHQLDEAVTDGIGKEGIPYQTDLPLGIGARERIEGDVRAGDKADAARQDGVADPGGDQGYQRLDIFGLLDHPGQLVGAEKAGDLLAEAGAAVAHHLQQRLAGQGLLEIKRSRIWLGHPGWHRQHQPVDQQPVLAQLRQLGAAHKAKLELAGEQLLLLDGGGHILQMHHHIGHLLFEAGDQRGGQRKARQTKANLEPTGNPARHRQRMALELPPVFDQRTCLGQQLGADGGQFGAVTTTIEQGAAEGLLQSLDLLGEGGLGNKEAIGRFPVVGGLGQHHERLQLFKVEFHSV